MVVRIPKIQLDDIIVFLLLFLSVGFVVSNDIIPSSITIAIWVGLMVLILWRGISLNVPILVVTFIALGLMLFTILLTGQSLFVFVKHAFSFLAVMIYVCNVSFQQFSKSFVRVVKFFCIVSLFGYLLHFVAPQLFSFNVVENVKGLSFSNFYIYVQWASGGFNAFRNWGFAWEPGAFATIICLAMLIELFVFSESISFKNVALYIVTVFSTMSTMGIVAVMCLCLYITVGSTSISSKVKKITVAMILIGVVFVLLFSNVFFDLSNNSVFGKIIRFINADGQGTHDSVSIRLYSITEVFLSFLKKPLFGWGYQGLIEETYASTRGMNTCTFLNWFAVYGGFYGSLMFIGITNFAKAISRRRVSWIITLIFIFAITMTEDYIHCPLIFILVLYGYCTDKIAEID